jgi:glycerophosphoryl diester phosphodiesterase
MPSTLNIAHRGARSIAPENTIIAARKAYEAGADMWELDTTMLADGELIIIHDDTFQRTTNIADIFPDRPNHHVGSFTSQEVAQLEAGSFYINTDPFGQIAAGNITPDDRTSFLKEPVPTLEQALLFTKDMQWQVNVEIKPMPKESDHRSFVEKVVALIQSHGMESQVLISSFNHDYLLQCRQLAPSIKTGWLTVFGHCLNLKQVKESDVYAYHPANIAMRKGVIRRYQKKGIAVNAWTVNKTADMQKLIGWGINGIITDFPQELNQLLVNR